MLNRLCAAAFATALSCGVQVSAEEGFYFGIGAGVSSAESVADVFPGVSNDTFATINLSVPSRMIT